LAVVAIYLNSLEGAFVFDDQTSISDNASIRSLLPVWKPGHLLPDSWPVFSPPTNGETVSGRPLLNLTFAVNWVIGNSEWFGHYFPNLVWGFHATNIAIHAVVALLLFGVVRRTLLLPKLAHRFGGPSTWIALAVAMLWAVHPIQTEAVAYVVQRAESLVSMFYLLTLYLVIRGMTAREPQSWWWYGGAMLASLLGMSSKEIMVTAPVVILLYDWTFVADSWEDIFKRRWGVYLGLAITWLLLFYLVIHTSLMGKKLDVPRVPLWPYSRSQPLVILWYLRLIFWPHPLCLDYEWQRSPVWPLSDAFLQIVLPFLVLSALAMLVIWGVYQKKAWGFLGAWFFLILGPTSSILPLGQLAFEHRIYLAMAGILTLVVVGGYIGMQKLVRSDVLRWSTAAPLAVSTVATVCVLLAILSFERNKDYRDENTMWGDVVSKAPHNYRAHDNYGTTIFVRGDIQGALAHFRKAVELNPEFASAHNNSSVALFRMGKLEEAAEHCRLALTYKTDFAPAMCNYGNVLIAQGKIDEAIAKYKEAVDLKPDYAEAQYCLGNVLVQHGRLAEGIEHLRRAVEINPRNAVAHFNLGVALVQMGNLNEAAQYYENAIKLDPGRAEAHINLGILFYQVGQYPNAVNEWREAIRLQPETVPVLTLLAHLLATYPDAALRNGLEAVALAERAAQRTGGYEPEALRILAEAYAEAGRFPSALSTAQRALEIAKGQGKKQLVDKLQEEINLYKTTSAVREPPAPLPNTQPAQRPAEQPIPKPTPQPTPPPALQIAAPGVNSPAVGPTGSAK
jgi:tetratricopeptide (TPR) repeat protein